MLPISALVLLSTVSLSKPVAGPPVQLSTDQTPHRIAGTTRFPMPDVLARKMESWDERWDEREVDYVGRICVGPDGVPKSVHAIHRTGVGQADRRVEKTVMGWRYAPYVVHGRAISFCTNVRYRFEMPLHESRTDW